MISSECSNVFIASNQGAWKKPRLAQMNTRIQMHLPIVERLTLDGVNRSIINNGDCSWYLPAVKVSSLSWALFFPNTNDTIVE